MCVCVCIVCVTATNLQVFPQLIVFPAVACKKFYFCNVLVEISYS